MLAFSELVERLWTGCAATQTLVRRNQALVNSLAGKALAKLGSSNSAALTYSDLVEEGLQVGRVGVRIRERGGGGSMRWGFGRA